MDSERVPSGSSPLRILIVATAIRVPGTHGGSTHVGELLRNLGKLGSVLLLAARGSEGDGIEGVGFEIGYPWGIRSLLPYYYYLRSIASVRKFAPTVIYERASSYGLGALLSRALGAPLLVMVLDEHYSRISLGRASRIIATDLALVPEHVRHKAVKVSWGANTDLFRRDLPAEKARARLGLGSSPVVAYTGSFKRWHGLPFLVEAAAKLRERPLRYLLIGDGPYRKEVEALVQSAGLSERFVFTGAVRYEQVPELLAAADICVAPFDPSFHPHSADGFVLDPLKVFEYLAMAKPTVTIRADNIERLFRDGEHLRLFEARNADALSRAIADLVDHPEKAKAMAEAGYAKVIAEHTWSSHANHLARLFREMMQERAER